MGDNENLEPGKASQSNGINKLHFIYIIIILSLFLISGFAFMNYNDNPLVGFIGFAATISSMILSILAIFITVLSNNSTNSFIHKIRDMYEKVSEIPTVIKTSISQMDNASVKMEGSASSIDNLTQKIDDLSQNIDEKLCRLEKLDGLEPMILKVDYLLDAKQNVKIDGSSIKIDKSSQVECFLERNSLSGIALTYGLYLSFIQNKIVKIQDYFGIFNAQSYYHGYIVCLLSSSQFMEIALTSSGDYKIESIDDDLKNKIESNFDTKMKEYFERINKELAPTAFQSLKSNIQDIVSKSLTIE